MGTLSSKVREDPILPEDAALVLQEDVILKLGTGPPAQVPGPDVVAEVLAVEHFRPGVAGGKLERPVRGAVDHDPQRERAAGGDAADLVQEPDQVIGR